MIVSQKDSSGKIIGFKEIPDEDVQCFIPIGHGKGAKCVTALGEFHCLTTFEEYVAFYEANDNYIKSDRGFLVNLKSVTFYSSKDRIVYFDQEFDKKSKNFATVSQGKGKMDKIIQFLGTDKDISIITPRTNNEMYRNSLLENN